MSDRFSEAIKRLAGQSPDGFELEVDDKDLRRRLPQELRVFEKAFKFTPIEADPFPKPEPKTKPGGKD